MKSFFNSAGSEQKILGKFIFKQSFSPQDVNRSTADKVFSVADKIEKLKETSNKDLTELIKDVACGKEFSVNLADKTSHLRIYNDSGNKISSLKYGNKVIVKDCKYEKTQDSSGGNERPHYWFKVSNISGKDLGWASSEYLKSVNKKKSKKEPLKENYSKEAKKKSGKESSVNFEEKAKEIKKIIKSYSKQGRSNLEKGLSKLLEGKNYTQQGIAILKQIDPTGEKGFTIKYLQKAIGANSDGIWGKNSFEALKKELFSLSNIPLEDKGLSKIQEKNFLDIFGDFPTVYGERLYKNSELISDKCELSPYKRLHQYLLKNGREKTFQSAEKLGCIHHRTLMNRKSELTNLFLEAGINLEGESLDWVEVPDEFAKSGGLQRNSEYFGGKDEMIMTVCSIKDDSSHKIIKGYAERAGYSVNDQSEFQGVVLNELSHEIQYKYFPKLFGGRNWGQKNSFENFTCEVPNIRFHMNAQVGEFLSDVANWQKAKTKGVYFRFFNSLFYMNDSKSKEDTYWYSHQVQRHAMEKVLLKKGYNNPKQIINSLLNKFEASGYGNDECYQEARKYFQEDDFIEIAKIYKRIGVQLIKKMKPYFKKPE